MNYGAALKELRKQKKINQTTIAEKLKMPISTFSYHERMWDFTPGELEQILRILKITESELKALASKYPTTNSESHARRHDEPAKDYRDQVIVLLKENADLKDRISKFENLLSVSLNEVKQNQAVVGAMQAEGLKMLLSVMLGKERGTSVEKLLEKIRNAAFSSGKTPLPISTDHDSGS